MTSKNIDNPSDITEFDLDEFIGFFEGSGVSRECLEEIYNEASKDDNDDENQDPPKPVETFVPINPNDSLVNCIPPKELSPSGAIAYLHELIQLKEESSCSAPFPISKLAVDSMDVSILKLVTPVLEIWENYKPVKPIYVHRFL
ncbi:MAG: hypothetical protein IPJ51_11705 [Saprospiraceae bacterium]|nr:hypothetical protein [Saprospiraceae bacterium]